MPDNSLPTFEQFAAIRRYGGNTGFSMAWSPDSKEIAYVTNTSGQFNVWKQPALGGYPVQLTFFADRSTRNLAWSRDGKTILFNADKDGDEFHQLFTIPAQGGRPTQLTDVPDATHLIGPGAFSPDGKWIAYATNAQDRASVNPVLLNLETGEERRLIQRDGNFFPAAWSPDGKHLLVGHSLSNTNSDIYLVDVKTGEAKNLTPHQGDIGYAPGPWSREKGKRGFYFVADEMGEHAALGFYDLKRNSRAWVETPEWDVEDVAVSRDGRLLAWTVNEDGNSRLHVRYLQTGRTKALPKMPQGVIQFMSFAPNKQNIALLMSGAGFCVQPFILHLKANKLQALTQSMLGGIKPAAMVEPKLIRYPSFDGRKVPAWLYKPKGLKPGRKVGVVLSVHGGPEAQERLTYNYTGMYQYWLSRGIGVLATNIRGSTGYGKTYQKLIHRDWGGGELQDMEHAVEYLHSLDWVDPNRIGFFGGSFGGFACLSCVTRLPDKFAAAVDLFGPSNLITFVNSVPPWWKRYMKEWVGDADQDRDFLVERSPITYVDRIRTPLYIIQGANDPRVVQAESDQIVEKLRARNVPVKYDVFPDEGHGFTKRANELKALGSSAEFLEQYLNG